jgi:hypothetical protein
MKESALHVEVWFFYLYSSSRRITLPQLTSNPNPIIRLHFYWLLLDWKRRKLEECPRHFHCLQTPTISELHVRSFAGLVERSYLIAFFSVLAFSVLFWMHLGSLEFLFPHCESVLIYVFRDAL